MDPLTSQHKDLAAGRWAAMPLHLQMANIGSEVSRAIKGKERGDEKRMLGAAYRALELFELSIDVSQKRGREGRGQLRELCRAKEEFCDYIFGNNEFCTDPKRLQRYYDQFACLRPKSEQ